MDVLWKAVKTHSGKWRKMPTEVEAEETAWYNGGSQKKKINHFSVNNWNLFNITRYITQCIQWWISHWVHTVVCVCSLWFEGMSCYRSIFSSWKRQKEALTSSHAATRPSVCSDSQTTAWFLKSGLRLRRPSSSPVTSVSGLRRTDNSWTTCQQCDVKVVFPKLPLSFTAAHLLSSYACSVFKGVPIPTKLTQHGCEHLEIKAESWSWAS